MGKNQRKKNHFIIQIGFDVILKSTCKTIKNMAIFGPNSIKNQLLLLFYYETLLILFYSSNTVKKISKQLEKRTNIEFLDFKIINHLRIHPKTMIIKITKILTLMITTIILRILKIYSSSFQLLSFSSIFSSLTCIHMIRQTNHLSLS